jgi:FHIPEP family
VQRVLKDLRRERVPIRDGISILEALGEAGSKTENQVRLTTYVRQALRRRDRRPAQIPSLDHSRDAGRVGAQRHDWDRHTGPWSGRLGRLQKLVQTVGQSPDQDAHLVVPATMKPAPSDRGGTRRCARGKRSPFCTGAGDSRGYRTSGKAASDRQANRAAERPRRHSGLEVESQECRKRLTVSPWTRTR